MTDEEKAPIFSEVMAWNNEKFEISIFDDNNFIRLKDITQVYGFIFNEKEELLVIRLPNKKDWCLPGGTPESIDSSWKETLIREVTEEADVEIKDITPCFYSKSKPLTTNNSEVKITILLRAIAKVENVNPQTPDPAHGKLNERKFIPSSEFLKYCPWGENGKVQLDLALKMLKKKL